MRVAVSFIVKRTGMSLQDAARTLEAAAQAAKAIAAAEKDL
jgi:hypothetical protein